MKKNDFYKLHTDQIVELEVIQTFGVGSYFHSQKMISIKKKDGHLN